MGLYAYFDGASCGLPDEVTASDLGYPEFEGEAEPIQVDYSAAIADMISTFLSVATSLVPVDTGYLQSSIHAEGSGTSASFYADAEYAQYVEYGTYKMRAQPYFHPALDQAIEVYIAEAMEAYTRAQQEMQAILQDIMAAAMAAMANMMGSPFGGMSPMGLGQMTAGAFYGGLALGAAAMILAFPLLVNLYGIMDTLYAPFDPMQARIDDLQINGIDVIVI